MKIQEQDLFNYIFFPTILCKQKEEYILIHKNKFKSEFDLMNKIKSQINGTVNHEIIDKIIQKIREFKKKTEIVLNKTNNLPPFNGNNLVLAAESRDLDEKVYTDTFQDKDSEFMVKIINSIKENKIFLLNRSMIELKNIKMRLDPSGMFLNIKSSLKPMVISPKIEITNITIIPENKVREEND